ncbi:MAG: hypothetical protein HY457_01955 [Parcubacteria group bacterium]|nr:hypothetical protein [Parcubacteria group bacterium]
MLRVRQSTATTVAVLVLVVSFFFMMSYVAPPANLASVISAPDDDEVWCSDSVNKSLGADLRFVEWTWHEKTVAAFFPAGPEVTVEVGQDGAVHFRRGSRAIKVIFDEPHQIVKDPSKQVGNMLGWLQMSPDYVYVTWVPDIRDLPSMSAECVANMFPDDPAMAKVRALAKN